MPYRRPRRGGSRGPVDVLLGCLAVVLALFVALYGLVFVAFFILGVAGVNFMGPNK